MNQEELLAFVEALRSQLPAGWDVACIGWDDARVDISSLHDRDQWGPVWPRNAWWLFPNIGMGGKDPTLYADDLDGTRMIADVVAGIAKYEAQP